MATQVPQSNRVHTKSQPHRGGTGLALISRVHERRQRPAARRPSGQSRGDAQHGFPVRGDAAVTADARAHERRAAKLGERSRAFARLRSQPAREGFAMVAAGVEPVPRTRFRSSRNSVSVRPRIRLPVNPLIVAGVDASRTIAVAPAPSGQRGFYGWTIGPDPDVRHGHCGLGSMASTCRPRKEVSHAWNTDALGSVR